MKYFKSATPKLIVITEHSVDTTIISPESFALLFIASAIIKDAIAVGLAKRINKINISSLSNCNNTPTKTAIAGKIIILRNDDIIDKLDADFHRSQLKDRPMLINANGSAISPK